jgi:hypothetical protein
MDRLPVEFAGTVPRAGRRTGLKSKFYMFRILILIP